jgi:RNA polymerase sigma factor (TIGR02999 family)
MAEPAGDVTTLLIAWSEGKREALDELMPLVYEDLRRVAHNLLRRERSGHTLATTGLVHEAYLRLVDQERARLTNRSHFYSLAAQMMRRVLIDIARKRVAARRGAGAVKLSLDDVAEPGAIEPNDELLALDEALTRFAAVDPDLSRLVELRYFGGLTLEEVAEVMGTSTTSVWRDWKIARAWLYDALNGDR